MSGRLRKRRVCILGSTGSVGLSTLAVIEQHRETFEVFALTAFSNIEKFLEQCVRFSPTYAVIAKDELYVEMEQRLMEAGIKTKLLSGSESLNEIVKHDDVDIVVAGIVGAAGLESTYHAIEGGKKVLIANKEPLVMAGDFLVKLAAKSNAMLLPIDSEHNAILQCLSAADDKAMKSVARIILTASGGPFWDKPDDDLSKVSPAEAIKHPTWEMGKKISIDSATMMNKGLEVIEAHYLFGLPVESIDVLVHPQSIVHSLVQFIDGSTLAHMAHPDMKIPISYALNYPDRLSLKTPQLDVEDICDLNFFRPDYVRFRCLKIAYQAIRSGRAAVISLNAINEVLVQAFLQNLIKFTEIPEYIDRGLSKIAISEPNSFDDIFEIDSGARRVISKLISLPYETA